MDVNMWGKAFKEIVTGRVEEYKKDKSVLIGASSNIVMEIFLKKDEPRT